MSTTKKVILSKPVDWDPWIAFVRAGATNCDIWGSCQFRLDREKTIEPQFKVPDDDNIFDKVGYEAYRARREVYKGRLAEYEHQKKAFGDRIFFIQGTITAHNVTYIQKEDPHQWNILGALKRRLAPSDEARSLEIEQNFYKLRKGPGARSIETWLGEWTAIWVSL